MPAPRNEEALRLRAQLLAALYPCLSSGGCYPRFPLSVVIYEAGRCTHTLTFDAAELEEALGHCFAGGASVPLPELPGPAQEAPKAKVRLSRIHRRLWEKAADGPVAAKKLITLTGYKYNSHSRAALTHLCRLDVLRHTPDGIVRGSVAP